VTSKRDLLARIAVLEAREARMRERITMLRSGIFGIAAGIQTLVVREPILGSTLKALFHIDLYLRAIELELDRYYIGDLL